MKKFFLALCISLFMPFVSLAQSYVRGPAQTATWTTSTTGGASGATVSFDMTKTQYQGVFVAVGGGQSLTAGAITFESGPDSSHVSSILLTRQSNASVESSYSFVASTNETWTGAVFAPYVQVRLSTAITASAGTGATTITLTPFVGPNTSGSLISVGTDTPCYLKSGFGSANDQTNHANCKNSTGVFKGVRALNPTATVAWLKMYNLATDPTCSSATGAVEDIMIPSAGTTSGSGIVDILSNFTYSTGIGFCLHGAEGSTDNTAPVAGVTVTISYN